MLLLQNGNTNNDGGIEYENDDKPTHEEKTVLSRSFSDQIQNFFYFVVRLFIRRLRSQLGLVPIEVSTDWNL